MDKIELYNENLNDPLNVDYKNLVNDIVNEINNIANEEFNHKNHFMLKIKVIFLVLCVFVFLVNMRIFTVFIIHNYILN